jgi:hypothetical protein
MKQIDNIQEVQFCATQMGISDNLLQNYRRIFISLEAIIFAFTLALRQFVKYPGILNYLVIIGIICAILWIFVCHHRGKEVWTWRDRLILKLKGTDLGKLTEELWKGRGITSWAVVHRISRYILNYVLPCFLIVCWLLFLIFK